MSSSAPLDSSKHLSLIDAGVSNIWSLSLPSHLESLNLHGNYIRHISNLSHLTNLRHLDLSANQISTIDGLDNLTQLQTLNLSCNLITSVEGLDLLRKLQRLNLSYNQIDNVAGLAALSGKSFCLSHLVLHGNKLRDVQHLVQCLARLKSLRHLVLSQDRSGNPLCHNHGYIGLIRAQVPQLETVNDMDKNGRLSKEVDSVATIPGLEAYLEFLLSPKDKENKSEEEQESCRTNPAAPLITPKIDAVMEQFKQRCLQESSSSSMERSAFPSSSPPRRLRQSDKDYSGETRESMSSEEESELIKESRQSHLALAANKSKQANKGRQGKKSLTRPESSAGSAKSGQSSATRRRQQPPLYSQQPQQKQQQQQQQYRQQPQRLQSHSKSSTTYQQKTLRFSDDWDRAASGDTDDVDDGCGGKGQGRSRDADTMYKELLMSLELERERRWKAEQAARRLAESLKDLQERGKESEEMKKQALEATTQIKQAMMNEHEANELLQTEVKKLQDELRETQDRLSTSQRAEERSREALKEAETTLGRKDAEEMATRIHQSKSLQESQQRAQALARECESLRHQLEAANKQLRQVQETLAVRENQHREELRNRFALNSPELKDVLDRKVKDVERSFQGDLVRQQEKAEKLSQQYSELEDEFRYALRTEESRFREMKTELEAARHETVENKQLLLVAQQKDESSTAMITELTQLVKEQKGRISELVKCKNEQTSAHKERVQTLEESLEDSRKQATQLELLKQAKSRLQATVQAQESVIDGLKAERKLWGQELAQQGASLSQDRGRLEAKIETLQAEVASLKKQLEREGDTVKIKTKMVDDQTETIKKLKEAIVERDETIRRTREESLEVQRSLEDQLAEHKAAVEETRDILDRAAARKEELKKQVSDLQAELKEAKEGHSILSQRWKEKSALIGRLEEQVTQMKTTWTKREVQLTAERDAALTQAKQAVNKLNSADTAFRQQIDLKETATRERIAHLEMEKQQEVELANRKVALVEEEMRDMLRENEATKRAMEAKVKKLNQALGDLQTDLM